MNYELKPLSFWALIGKTIMMYINHAVIFSLIMILSYLPFYAVYVFTIKYPSPNVAWVGISIIASLVFLLAAHAFTTGLMCYITWKIRLGEKINIVSCIKRAASHIIQLSLISFILLILAVCCFLPLYAGLVIVAMERFFPPISIVAVSVVFSLLLLALLMANRVIIIPVYIIEKTKVSKLGKRCSELLKGAKMQVFGLNLIMFVLIGLFYSIEGAVILLNKFVLSFTLNITVLQIVSQFISLFLFVPLYSIFSTLIYCNMRIKKEGLDVEQLSHQFIKSEPE